MAEQNEDPATQEDELRKVAQQLVDANKKVQLIYAFNSTGKTRLSKALIDRLPQSRRRVKTASHHARKSYTTTHSPKTCSTG